MPRAGPKYKGRDTEGLRERLRDKIKPPPPPPSPANLQTPPQIKRKYRVKKDDNWFNIAQKELGDQALADNIVRVNPSIKNLRPGMIINVPGGPLTAAGKNYAYDVQMRGRGVNRGGEYTAPTQLDTWGNRIENLYNQATNFLSPLRPINQSLTTTAQIGTRNIGRLGTRGLKNFLNIEGGYTQPIYPNQVSSMSGVRSANDPRSLQQAYQDAQNTRDTIHAAAQFYTQEEVRNLHAYKGGSMARGRMVGESPLYQLFKGKDPDFIDPRSQHVLKMSDQDMRDAGYVWDEENGVWLRQQDVQNYTFNGAGAYSGSTPYGYRGYGYGYGGGGGRRGGGGGGGGRLVGGAPGTGGYQPPPGTFGLVTWSM